MSQLLQLFIIIPLLGFIISLLIPRKKESVISSITISTVAIHMLLFFIFAIFWLAHDHPILDIKHIVLFKAHTIEIFIDFYFDKITAVFVLIGSILMLLVSVFSRFYLHREEGFKRFFNTILFFYLGYNIVVFSGNFETLFMGWEILGICSFLLIAFYRDRYLPVKNGLKVIFIYRVSDICLILAMWMSHHLWHENITFLKFNNHELIAEHLQQYHSLAIFISVMLIISAAAKSAQIPFSSWLPRAMEGPTTSSAIFYGSLSVHLGVFLLLRTFPFWESLVTIKVIIILTGLFTSIIATGIARVQSSVKTQIAYSSVAQIGLIFIEVALGFHNLALFHFAGNAFLRTYQLLVSPSVLNYLIHDQFYNYVPSTDQKHKDSIFKRIKYSFYIMCVKEWDLDFYLYRFLWMPFKWVGKKFDFFTNRWSIVSLGAIYLFGLYCVSFKEKIPERVHQFLPLTFALLALLFILKAFTDRGDAKRGWVLVISSHFFITLSASLNTHFEFDQVLIYLCGTVVSAVVGFICLHKIKSIDNNIYLNQFHGYVYEQPKLALVFLLSCLGLIGFPITPSFIGIDLIFTHIYQNQLILLILTSLSFLFIELSVLRIYARIFLGQHKKAYHAIAYRSS